MQKNDISLFLFTIALILYAAMSSPTPDSPGLVEAAIGLILSVLSVGGAFALIKQPAGALQISGFMLLIYGLSAGVFLGLIHDQAPDLMLRDLIPFGFLFLPLFLAALATNHERWLLTLTLIMGAITAIRALNDMLGFLTFDLNILTSELTYLANAPTILLMTLISLHRFMHSFTGQWRLSLLLYAALALLGLIVMALSLQRASLGFTALYGAVLLLYYGALSPGRITVLVTALITIFIAFSAQDVLLLLDAIIDKTQRYGVNKRDLEWQALWDAATANGPLALLFGHGWGASFISPATDGDRVNFTHGIFGAMILKIGLIGASLTATYMLQLGKILMQNMRTQPWLALALAGPFLIDVTLYGAYKSLDFGVILMLIASLKTSLSGCPATINTQTSAGNILRHVRA